MDSFKVRETQSNFEAIPYIPSLMSLKDAVKGDNVEIFHKKMPREAIDLASRLLQYSPSLRCSAVRVAGMASVISR
ncbi:hypothetical protein RIF29_25203 [Crotalaria pallida]|uniref:Uncharacterized protein n=1 Tax=Crotalaria pallida TaxID=3830 RepID=A0AAN9ELZ9_CROPI